MPGEFTPPRHSFRVNSRRLGLRRIKDPRLGFVTITDVRVTGDSQQATIFYTVLGVDGDDEAAMAGTAAALESAKGLLRSEIAKQLAMRQAPSLAFVQDALPETARHLDELLARARQSDEQVAAARAGATYAGEVDPYRKPRDEDDGLDDDSDENTASDDDR